MNLATSQARVRVLFVDDEDKILHAMRRMLHALKDQWDIHFLNSGEKALTYLEKNPADVIVTDMRMPGMDGAELLAEVSRRHPGMLRIVLSGFSDQSLITRTICTSHQFLDKPCNAERLTSTINQSLRLRNLISNEEIRVCLSGLNRLPCSLNTYKTFIAEISKANTTTASIASVIESDVALTAKVLKLVNSAYYGVPSKITTCRQAVQLLGLETIRSVVAMSSFLCEFEDTPGLASVLDKLGQRSMEIATLAAEIIVNEGGSDEQRSYALSAGLLSHVGSLLLLANFPESFQAICAICDDDGASIVDAERTVLKETHAAIGAYLLSLWGFPDPVVEAVLYHHRPSAEQSISFGPTSAVHVAQALAKIPPNEPNADAIIASNLDMKHLAVLGKVERLPQWRKLSIQLFEKRERI
jgi:HD-like signal output (HDOD) protein/CheY-like chemotaxis protein